MRPLDNSVFRAFSGIFTLCSVCLYRKIYELPFIRDELAPYLCFPIFWRASEVRVQAQAPGPVRDKMIILASALVILSSESLRTAIELLFAELSAMLAENFTAVLGGIILCSTLLGTIQVLPRPYAMPKSASMLGLASSAVLLAPTVLAFQEIDVNMLPNLGTFKLNLPEHVTEWLDKVDRSTWLLPYWNHMLDNFTDFQIMSLGTFILHELIYFSAWVPYILIDQIPAFKRYKIQERRPNTWKQTWKCLKQLAISHTLIQFPMILFTKWGLQHLGFTMDTPLPRLSEILPKVLGCFIIEDFYFYWLHRFLHWKKIYKYIHKVHHEHAAPFGIAAEYAHPVETMLLGVGTILGPLFFTRHLLTLWVWLACRLLETVEDHSGYELPWNPSNFFPFWGGSVHHDFHHKNFEGNYASVFTIWDRIFGTDVDFRVDQSAKRAVGKSMWKDGFDRLSLAPAVVVSKKQL